MSYKALYRTYRPKTFDEVSGQKVIVQTLKNSIENNLIGHAYLFSGPRGTGKTSVAKIFSKAVNCLNPQNGNPCNNCEICRSINNNENLDIIEIDAASNNGVNDIRDLKDKVNYLPTQCKYKVYIIDEVHMLTNNAFNALLKTLEEPPKHVIFILATTEMHKLLPTIISRCQKFNFKNIDIKNIIANLIYICTSEKIGYSEEAILAIARLSEGGMRDAIGLLDQVTSFTLKPITEDDVYQISGNISRDSLKVLLSSIINGDTIDAIKTFDDIISSGKEASRIIIDLVLFIKNTLYELIEKNTKSYSKELFDKINPDLLYYYIDVLTKLLDDLRFTALKRSYCEISIIKLCSYKDTLVYDYQFQIDYLKKEIEGLKNNKETSSFNKTTNETVIRNNNSSNLTVKALENVTNNNDKTIKSALIDYLSKTIIEDLEIEFIKYAIIECASDDEILLTLSNFNEVNKCYLPNINKKIVDFFKPINQNLKRVITIRNIEFVQVKRDFATQKKNGITFVKLNEVNLGISAIINTDVDNNKETLLSRLESDFEGVTIKEEDK